MPCLVRRVDLASSQRWIVPSGLSGTPDAVPHRIPTRQLELATVPAADAETSEVIRFAQTYNGYKAVGMEGIQAISARLKADGPDGFSLDELRAALFARQRAHYHQGGAWPGGSDPLMDEMRELVAAIRQRVEAGEHLQRTGPELVVWTGDITTLSVHAIVNAANERLVKGGGVDAAIHAAAGPELQQACLAIPEVSPGIRCPTGQARITSGFNLSANHVIHAVGPRWTDGAQGEDHALAAAYRSVLGLAEAHQRGTLAIPAISTGVYGFPPARAASIAAETIRAWRGREWPCRVTLVGFDAEASRTLQAAVEATRRDVREYGDQPLHAAP